MQWASTKIQNGAVELAYGDLDDPSQDGMILRMRLLAGNTDALAHHELATLQQARDVIAEKIQGLLHILDPNS